MPGSRQDAWTQDEDLILAEFVLRHIREGSTQLVAFEEVGKKLMRTSAACGFRWNSFVRKQYSAGIELAKKQRKENKKNQLKGKTNFAVEVETVEENTPKTETMKLIDVITFLESLQSNTSSKSESDERMKKEIQSLKEENKALQTEVVELEGKLHVLEQEYRALIEIMDKARKLVLLDDRKKTR